MWRSLPEDRRRLAWAAALALATAACGAVDESAGGGPGGPDGGPGACSDVFDVGGRCVGPVPDRPALVCAYVADLEAECTDADGDCYVSGCDRPLPADLLAGITDCDDARPAVHPGAGELCDGLDGDCDGEVDEGFAIGEPCDNGCGAGKVECSVHDPTTTACSTDAGQSRGRPEGAAAPPEICDGLDDDCDGEVDEACRVDLHAAESRGWPLLCDGDLLFVEDGALVRVPDGARPDAVPGDPIVVVEGPGVAYPACGPAGLAWLAVDPDDAEACTTPPDGPLRCRAHLWTRADEDEPGVPGDPIDRTGLAEIGPPVVRGEDVLWHAIVSGRIVLRRTPLAGGSIVDLAENLSDPALGPGDHMAVREWLRGRAGVLLVGLAPGVGDRTLTSPPDAAPGPPTLGDGWAVWSLGRPATLWGVALDEGAAGFQLTDLPGDQRSPRLDGTRLVWLDTGASPPALREMDLRTGVGAVVARGEIAPGDFAVRDGVVVWIAREADGPRVYRHRLTD